MGLFPPVRGRGDRANPHALIRPVEAALDTQQHDEWAESRRYLDLEGLATF